MCLHQIDRAYLYALYASTHQNCGAYQEKDIYFHNSVFSEGQISIIRHSPLRQARFEVSKLWIWAAR